MKGLTIVFALVFAATFLPLPRNGGGWFWDFGNGLGFFAFGGLLFQMIPPLQRPWRRHELLGYWVLGAGIVHAFWFLGGDGTVRFYLLPGAPAYMWLGLAALIAMAVLAVLARMPDRMRIHRRFQTFRQAHRVLAYLTVAAAFLHIVLSGFYLRTWPQIVLLALVAAAACFGRQGWTRLGASSPPSGLTYLAAGVMAVSAFVLIRNLGQ